MKKSAAADVVIFGGGVAGLWLLHRVRQSGLSALLFESGTLGGGQTHKSQGIIHGGMKYALQGMLTKETQSLSDMPTVWRQCINGTGEINLKDVPVLSHQHYLWSPTKFAAKFTGFLASSTLTSKVEPLAKTDYPAVFKTPAFKGEVFSLDEIVIDVPALIRELVKANQDAVFKIEPLCREELKFNEDGKLLSAGVYMAGKSLEVTAQHFIFTAGAGNEVVLKALKKRQIAMQLRPLHMVLVRVPFEYTLYAHCLGLGPRPRMTVTTHHMQDGSSIWYLGGQIAEDGIRRDSAVQIQATQAELHNLFPWLDFSKAEFATFMIDRAEPKTKTGLKPETVYSETIENMTIAWPTKLALAPKLAADILQHLQQQSITPTLCDIRELRAWPMPALARPIWEEMFCKNVA